MNKSQVLLILIVLFSNVSLSTIISQSCSDGSYSYDDDILPILVQKCAGCHGGVSGFTVTTYASLLAGGNNCGPGVTPGDPSAAGSSLIDKTQWVTNAPNASCGSNMPLAGTPLTIAEFNAIQTWIGDGAPEMCTQSPCPPDFSFSGAGGLTGSETGTVSYETDGLIESTQLIASSANVDYDSGTAVHLFSGFEVVQGAQFEAFIDGCL